MRVYKPSDNPITGIYTDKHKAYDRAGLNLPDEVKAGMDGVIIERADVYNTNWQTIGALATKDYGNYIKVKHDDGSFELHAHLKQGTSLVIGTRVKAGQVVARIGNTGNSTGPHIHSEYRNAQNINVPVEFYTASPQVDLQKELDKVRAERDINWNLYQQVLKDFTAYKEKMARTEQALIQIQGIINNL